MPPLVMSVHTEQPMQPGLLRVSAASVWRAIMIGRVWPIGTRHSTFIPTCCAEPIGHSPAADISRGTRDARLAVVSAGRMPSLQRRGKTVRDVSLCAANRDCPGARGMAAAPLNLQPAGASPKCRIWDALAGLCLAALLAGAAAAADKGDGGQLTNGDRLTCEIKKLDQSVLSISTDPLGSASVHWGEIVGVTSPRTFDVQLA